MKRRLGPYILMAIASACLVLWVSMQTAPKHELGMAWESFKSEEVKGISFVTPKLEVRFTPLSLSYGWLKSSATGQVAQTILVGSKGKDFWFNLSPLWASKVLGPATNFKLSDYGLDLADKNFTIELADGRTLAYRIGGRGFQSSDYFVLDLQKQQIFLWDRMAISLLERASSRLALEEPSFLHPEGLSRIVLQHGGKTRSLERDGKDWKEGTKVIFEEEPFLRWLERLSQLKIASTRQPGALTGDILFELSLEGPNRFELRFVYDAVAKVYVLMFGEDHPQLCFAEAAFAALYKEFQEGNYAGPP